jgi:hypothetical protein
VIGLFLATVLLAVAGAQLHVVDERGASVVGAAAIFRSAAGTTSTETTDKTGLVTAPTTFGDVSLTVSARLRNGQRPRRRQHNVARDRFGPQSPSARLLAGVHDGCAAAFAARY